MAHLLRGKQSGVQNDLSEGLSSSRFLLDDFARYGINSQISTIAYDPVQSILAVGTNDTQFGAGQIYVFGKQRICVTFQFPRKASARFLSFCREKLVCVDSKHDINIFSLATHQLLVSYAPPSFVTSFETDPSIDYAFVGLQSGDVIAYDLDRETLTPFKIPNLWTEQDGRVRLVPVVSLALSPRDVGKILVGYPEGAVVFTFKQNAAQKYFVYELPPGSIGGNAGAPSVEVRRPSLTQAIWHPNGIFILTIHEDTSLVLWDTKDGRKIMARTIHDTNVDQPVNTRGATAGIPAGVKDPISQVAWCVKGNNVDDTGLLIAGGHYMTEGTKGLTFFDMGATPNYQTSTWQMLSSYFEQPRQEMTLQTPPGARVVNFCLIPRTSPYFAGAHDPIAVLALLSSGELITLSFPSGFPISPTNMLHVSLSFVHPFVTKMALMSIDRSAWLGLRERRLQGPKFLKGGMSGKRSVRRFESRNIVITAHGDGTMRLWDAGHDDEIENEDVIQVDLARAVGRVRNIEVTEISMSGSTGELSVGLKTGEIVVFRWGGNKNFGRDDPVGRNAGPDTLTKVTHRTDPGLKQGFLPLTLLEMDDGQITAVKNSGIGFVAAGSMGGNLTIIDLRGPALIHKAHMSEFLKPSKRGSLFKPRHSEVQGPEWPTSIEFGVLALEGRSYSSICCFVGTSRGNVATFEILPGSTGGYSVFFAGATALDDRVINICPMDVGVGRFAIATPNAVAGLRHGVKIDGAVVAATASGCRVFKPPIARGAGRTWDGAFCDAASVVNVFNQGYSLVGLFGDGTTRAYSIPSLKEFGCNRIDHLVDMRRLSESAISSAGTVLAWTGPSEVALLNAWGSGIELPTSEDITFNEQAIYPPRPTISNIQWISGTQYVSPADMDTLIGGPTRPPSKRMIAQMRQDQEEERKAARERRAAASNQPYGPPRNDEGYFSSFQRAVQEGTGSIGSTGETMDKLEADSSNWAEDVNKFVNSQKRKATLGLLGSKFGL